MPERAPASPPFVLNALPMLLSWPSLGPSSIGTPDPRSSVIPIFPETRMTRSMKTRTAPVLLALGLAVAPSLAGAQQKQRFASLTEALAGGGAPAGRRGPGAAGRAA